MANCRQHDWQPAFRGPESEVKKWRRSSCYRDNSEYQRCANCGAFGVMRLDKSAVARKLPEHEVEAYGVREHLKDWEEVIANMPKTLEQWRETIKIWEDWLAEQAAPAEN